MVEDTIEPWPFVTTLPVLIGPMMSCVERNSCARYVSWFAVAVASGRDEAVTENLGRIYAVNTLGAGPLGGVSLVVRCIAVPIRSTRTTSNRYPPVV